MKTLFQCFRRWWFDWIGQSPPYETLFVESDPPTEMVPNTFYVIIEDGFPWYASLVCPCGCGEVLHMNLLTDERPYWSLVQHFSGLSSLRPSVKRTKTCKSHFWYIKGRIRWC